MQQKGIYTSNEENTEDKGRMKEKRRLKAGNFRNQEK
jgi:hypothetical protein